MVNFDVTEILEKLSLDEKIGLLSGSDFWHTQTIPRLGIPSLRMCDGPNGIRGVRHFNPVPASCLPCGTALGALWDPDLVEAGGRLMGQEARAKGVHILLGPTVNIQRSPLGGRGFESYSEDPFLSGTLAAAQIRGIQAEGVATTIKHFVCNDQEHQRKAVNILVSERALREIYMMPFQVALRHSDPWGLMTSYNKVNGTHVSESSDLLQKVLLEEWSYKGFLLSDWFGTYSTSEAIRSGLDLEMPGPSTWRGFALKQALRSNKVAIWEIEDRVRRVLHLIKKGIESGIPEAAPDCVGDIDAARPLLRQLASSSIVLLKNDGNLLPLKKDKTVAVIGPNAKAFRIHGSGSAAVHATYAVSPYQGIKQKVTNVTYAKGVEDHKKLPLMNGLLRTPAGNVGYLMKFYAEPPSCQERKVIDAIENNDTMVYLTDYRHDSIDGYLYYSELEAYFEPEASGEYTFGLAVYGTAKLYVDGDIVVDNSRNQTLGDSFWGAGTREEKGTVNLTAGIRYKIQVDFGTAPTQSTSALGSTNMGAGGFRLGCALNVDAAAQLAAAVEIAGTADQVIICTGLNEDWESEGFDRETMKLPGLTDELIRRVCAVNPNTTVVIQSGTPVTMPWVHQVPAIVQAWYGGNETGNAIADVLFGDVNPSGKLPLSIPVCEEDNPAFLNSKSEAFRILYGEDIFVGYRYYEKVRRAVAFPFGHGLSFSDFSIQNLRLSECDTSGHVGENLTITVDVHNKSPVNGYEVVQVYVRQLHPSISRPMKELRGYKKVLVPSYSTVTVEILVVKQLATSFWDERKHMWIMEKDTYEVQVGSSSEEIAQTAEFEVLETQWWRETRKPDTQKS
ncbi:beta-glucosidase I [Pestalotiopsis fici W106-1]|uniref:Probable beta-glucosidase I n=1 Tax=Pestalotiopsis fici (strain W106-1 / CGMCC3.15140) TaxID=1229662 RepID=W3X2A1_PESFW|nr:beta-glucosidase I [Pestalotiopsis fici W106-1]ETS79281.1 beta-glucosidase I [Pestalotiopsis fici W106-1]